MKGISVITEDRNLFIWVLEYGERNISRRISSDEMLNTAVDEGLINSHSEPKAEVLRKIFYECFNIEKLRSQYSHAPQVLQQMSSSLMTEYYFRLIEYRELQLARENAELARENSVLARKHAETATL